MCTCHQTPLYVLPDINVCRVVEVLLCILHHTCPCTIVHVSSSIPVHLHKVSTRTVLLFHNWWCSSSSPRWWSISTQILESQSFHSEFLILLENIHIHKITPFMASHEIPHISGNFQTFANKKDQFWEIWMFFLFKKNKLHHNFYA